jgi:glycosyltransferase involved in cell wall biosynthesis
MRLRLLAHVRRLEAEGHLVEVCLLRQGRRLEPLRVIPRLAKLLHGADVVVVQRVLERPINALLAASSTPLVFDFDDALHLVRAPRRAPAGKRDELRGRLMARYRSVVRGSPMYSSRRRLLHRMSRLARVVIAGNDWLRNELGGVARKVVVIPTTVEIDRDRLKAPSDSRPLTIGWVGTSGDNFAHLRTIDEALRTIASRYGDAVRLAVVSSRPYDTTAIATDFVPWSLAGESDAVSRFDVGVMPLTDDLFALGKCAFKAVLCMGHRVPVVLSPVGANLTLVEDRVDGLFAGGQEEWVAALSALLDDVGLRERIGAAGFEKVRSRYSTVQSYAGFVGALNAALEGHRGG